MQVVDINLIKLFIQGFTHAAKRHVFNEPTIGHKRHRRRLGRTSPPLCHPEEADVEVVKPTLTLTQRLSLSLIVIDLTSWPLHLPFEQLQNPRVLVLDA